MSFSLISFLNLIFKTSLVGFGKIVNALSKNAISLNPKDGTVH